MSDHDVPVFRTVAALLLFSTAAHARGLHFTIYEVRDGGTVRSTAQTIIGHRCWIPDAGRFDDDAKKIGCRSARSGIDVFAFEGRLVRGVKDGRTRWEWPAPGKLAFHDEGLMVFETVLGRRAIWFDVETGSVTRTLDLARSRGALATPQWCGDRIQATFLGPSPGVMGAECLVLD